MFWPEPTHQPIHPPTHHTTHPPMGGEFFTDLKSSNGIEISWLVQALSNFYWFWGSTPWGGGRWVDGDGGRYGCVGGVPWIHTCTRTHACMHAHTCMLNMLIMLNMDASMSAAISNFYTCIHVCVCMCVHASVCACVGGHPHAPRCPWHPPKHLPPPQSHRKPKTPKFNKSWTNRDNSILF